MPNPNSLSSSLQSVLVDWDTPLVLAPLDPKTWLSDVSPTIADVLSGQIGNNSEAPVETPKFWLTIEEKASIEADINAGKPITATPAYTKFLSALLPSWLKIEDENGLLKFSLNAPEYEVYNGAIRLNHAGATAIIVDWLSKLFDRVVRLPTAREVYKKIAEHDHFVGYREKMDTDRHWNNSWGESKYIGDTGTSWIKGRASENEAPLAWRIRDGTTSSGMGSRRDGLSLFPFFG